jgi:hypothetical protein
MQRELYILALPAMAGPCENVGGHGTRLLECLRCGFTAEPTSFPSRHNHQGMTVLYYLCYEDALHAGTPGRSRIALILHTNDFWCALIGLHPPRKCSYWPASVTAGTPTGWIVCVICTVNYIYEIMNFREWFGECAVIKEAHKAKGVEGRHGERVGIWASIS